jgi:hypothetical protein
VGGFSKECGESKNPHLELFRTLGIMIPVTIVPLVLDSTFARARNASVEGFLCEPVPVSVPPPVTACPTRAEIGGFVASWDAQQDCGDDGSAGDDRAAGMSNNN